MYAEHVGASQTQNSHQFKISEPLNDAPLRHHLIIHTLKLCSHLIGREYKKRKGHSLERLLYNEFRRKREIG